MQVDKSEDIEEIVWRVDSKIAEVRRTSQSQKKNLRFDYDAMGNRIAKHIYTDNQFTDWERSTYYVRDASGNVMAVYDREATGQEPPSTFRVSERHIYGSSRLGMDVTTYDFISTTYTITNETTRELGRKQYEISNHLGNVLSVITDQKLPVQEDDIILSYTAVIITATDYSPFGVGLYGRSWSGEYRYGFNGKERDDEGMGGGNQTYDYGFRIYNPGLAKFLSTDPLSSTYPWYTPYQFAGNKPIWAIDLDGLEEYKVTGNTITITMKFAAFTSRPEGGNVPNESDIKMLSKQHWEAYNKENSSTVGLSITYDNDGNVTSVSTGEAQYNIIFDVQIELFDNEKSPEYIEFSKSSSFTGVYLFGNTEFEHNKIEHNVPEVGTTESTPAFTTSITNDYKSSYYGEEIVAFQDINAFTKTVEIHEDGHTIGLSHWGTAIGFAKVNPQTSLKDCIYGTKTCFDDGGCYDTEGMMKCDGVPGSQAMKRTQVVNSLNSMEGKK